MDARLRPCSRSGGFGFGLFRDHLPRSREYLFVKGLDCEANHVAGSGDALALVRCPIPNSGKQLPQAFDSPGVHLDSDEFRFAHSGSFPMFEQRGHRRPSPSLPHTAHRDVDEGGGPPDPALETG